MVTARATIANAGTARASLIRDIEDAVIDDAHDLGKRMVQLANEAMEKYFDLDRPPERRRHPGSRRARGALDYHIDGRSLPVLVQYRVLGGEDVLKRILGMNYAIPAHRIRPSGVWEGAGGASRAGISPRSFRLNPRFVLGQALAWPDNSKPGGWAIIPGPDGVMWTPNTLSSGMHFLEDSMEQALAEWVASR